MVTFVDGLGGQFHVSRRTFGDPNMALLLGLQVGPLRLQSGALLGAGLLAGSRHLWLAINLPWQCILHMQLACQPPVNPSQAASLEAILLWQI